MSYQDIIEYLFGLQKHGIKFGLSTSVRLLEGMGAPHQAFRSLHVAGTNGKGSTSAFLASMLKAAGYRTGLYTSPHLVSFTERIRIDGAPISEARVVDLASRVREQAGRVLAAGGREGAAPTFFEVTTAMAFTCFAEEQVDIAVVEAGMGGRLDCTNVITPLVSIITNIDLEHTEFLGSTLEQIAREKAGIIKPGVPVVTGVVQPEACAVIAREAAAQGAALHCMPHDFAAEPGPAGRPQRFDYRGLATDYRALEISLIGRHQAGNAALAVAAIECARQGGVEVDEGSLRRGLAAAVWEGRLEQVAALPDLFLDGAHNPASASVLAEALRVLKPRYRRLVLVIGILQDKDHRGIIAPLAPLADRIISTAPRYARALAPERLAEALRPLHGAVSVAGTVQDALDSARADAASEDLIVVTGSLYTVGEARACLVPGAVAGALGGLKG